MTWTQSYHLLEGLSEYLDGDASPKLCAEIERHLAGCTNCRVTVETLSKTVLLYRELPQPVFSAEARQCLYRALDLEEFFP